MGGFQMKKSFVFPLLCGLLFHMNSLSCFLIVNTASSTLTSKLHQGMIPKIPKSVYSSLKDKTDEKEIDEITKKYGLEAGLYNIFTKKESGQNDQEGKKTINLNENTSTSGEKTVSKGKGTQAKELLAKYGGAYLATSISLAIVSFSLCYLLVDNGVDVASLLAKVGITPSDSSEKAGTAAIAYAAHKAASPIRFPPTVALTPVVANWMGKKVDEENKENMDQFIDEQEM